MLETGNIVALKGPLGAGKTCFVKGIASGLGVVETITSPTYTIISEYEAFLRKAAFPGTSSPVPLYHIDAYRLNGSDEFSAIGGEEIIFGNGISLIEWSERVQEHIPDGAFRVNIEIGKEDLRLISIYQGANLPSGGAEN